MRIEYDVKLGFKDVMFRPKRSTLKSRSQVDLDRTFKFMHTDTEWTGVPIMAANMDTVGTFEMARALAERKLFTAMHKHYTPDEWAQFLASAPEGIENYVAVSTGTGEADFQKLITIKDQHPQLKFICIDVANGYSEHFVSFLKKTREQFPDKVILAGNVVTGEMVEELLLAGADIVKVGIGAPFRAMCPKPSVPAPTLSCSAACWRDTMNPAAKRLKRMVNPSNSSMA
jgi:GMP reductase